MPENKSSLKYANKITMPMLIKLLATNMVANNFFGRSKRLAIIWMRLDFASKPFSISVLENEKRATSAPEISAEQNKSKNISKTPKTIETSIEIIKLLKLAGSGSNIMVLVKQRYLVLSRYY